MDYCVPQYNMNTNNNFAHFNVSLFNNLRDQVNCKFYVIVSKIVISL